MLGMFGQTFETSDLVTIGVLIVLEGVLSVDNALVLGMLASRLPKNLQSRALTYGLVGAFLFRFISVGAVQYLMRSRFVMLLGGLYLLYISLKHFFFESKEEDDEVVRLDDEGNPVLVHEATGIPVSADEAADEIKARTPVPVNIHDPEPGESFAPMKFWKAVVVIELTDIAFAVDSILAAIGMVPHSDLNPHPKLWVVVTGGLIGVMLMRVAASLFISLLAKFPRFEVAGYLLVILIGVKLLVEWHFNAGLDMDDPSRLNFHSLAHRETWIFWTLMILGFCIGFIPHKKPAK